MNPLHDLLIFSAMNLHMYHGQNTQNQHPDFVSMHEVDKQIIKEKQGAESRYSSEYQKEYPRCGYA